MTPVPEVYLLDHDMHPEDEAMVQALQSRSDVSMRRHLERIRESGSGRFMDRYYVGYGHKSIGDCASLTAAIEGVSMLCAKALQHHPLYSGQERSTRYIDFTEAHVYDPFESRQSEEIIEGWIEFYSAAISDADFDRALRERFPNESGAKSKVYERAIAAKRFDILRGFLPAGCLTGLSWHSNLRQFSDHLDVLCRHPLPEVSTAADILLERLQDAAPHSFPRHSVVSEKMEYLERASGDVFYSDDPIPVGGDDVWFENGVDGLRMSRIPSHVFSTRPPRTPLPDRVRGCGTMSFSFHLDFGSFRDLQRHRSGPCTMPLLRTTHGFEAWYLEQLTPALRERAEKLIEAQEDRLALFEFHEPVKAQYLIAMGYRCSCRVSWDLKAATYVLELRSGKRVHPTLRSKVLCMVEIFKTFFPGIALHADESPGEWDVRRGGDTIEERTLTE